STKMDEGNRKFKCLYIYFVICNIPALIMK
ncbi:uncharacterized protein METZ01_LOCUS312283, partial [marine metagenome]